MFSSLSKFNDFLSSQNQWIVALYVFLGTIALLVLKSWYDGRQLEKLLEEENIIGE